MRVDLKVGTPFNPYKIFQGVFAPYWVLEHTGIGTGAKLCYIRLLGFAGKDARCYPALATLGMSLGVSERQAREYVKELESAGLIAVEQRGLRKTNAYFFLWTKELDDLSHSMPDRPDDPDGPDVDVPGTDHPDRKNCSGQDRNTSSAPDRKKTAGQDRKPSAGPIGINSLGVSPVESSSSPTSPAVPEEDEQTLNRPAQVILEWANSRRIERLRSDRRVGPPEKGHLTKWAAICSERGLDGQKEICFVMDAARKAADRSENWRAWSYLTIQVQLAIERFPFEQFRPDRTAPGGPAAIEPEADCEWTQAKAALRRAIPAIAFSNWFDRTRQVERSGASLTVSVPDEPTRDYLEIEYRTEVLRVATPLGIDEVRFVIDPCRCAIAS